ncbi:MAG: acyl-CoA dehydrogenase [Acidobacteriota bacterium]
MFGMLLALLRRQGAAPEMSATERAALEAGDVWLDGELFSGRPKLQKILDAEYPQLTERERAFLDGPVEEVLQHVDPQLTSCTKELPEAAWEALRRHRFFGLGIPVEYGGHGFSALAQSTIFGKLACRSMAASTVVLITNSVGPGELLVEVGTDEQRRHYLPRLARGEEIPCFALTEPEAGSDAASMTSKGVLFKQSDGELAIRLQWQKRYITLAPIATLLGLAFRLEDPEGLLGGERDLGITCALVPTNLPGVEVGRRHDPLGIPFPNGPTSGRDVVIPASQIIGGVAQAGGGWKMLMEALSGGRAISLPSQAATGAKYVARIAGAYAAVRRQFGLAVGRFEGVEEPLARIGARAYLLEAARVMTCGAVDAGFRPAVVSAMVKYNATELSRQTARDGMDVLGGAAICLGPRNLMASAWQTAPVGITVEGANILTRSLIVFGQGAIRCHPHAHALLESIRTDDKKAFRRALIRHQLHFASNAIRGAWHSVTRGRFVRSPVSGPAAKYYRRLAWCSARFAFYADLAMMTLGGQLKFRGKLTGRFADILSSLYLMTTALRRFEAEGRPADDLPLLIFACEERLAAIQESFEGLLQNLDIPVLGAVLRGPVLWWTRLNPVGARPTDRTGGAIARLMQRPGAARDRLTSELYVHPDSAWERLEEAFELAVSAEAISSKLRTAVRRGEVEKGSADALIAQGLERGLLSAEDADLLERAAAARREVIQVDDFSLEELRSGAVPQNQTVDGAARQLDAAGG